MRGVVGSRKQIAWMCRIWKRLIAQSTPEQARKLHNLFGRKEDAPWWIERRDWTPQEILCGERLPAAR